MRQRSHARSSVTAARCARETISGSGIAFLPCRALPDLSRPAAVLGHPPRAPGRCGRAARLVRWIDPASDLADSVWRTARQGVSVTHSLSKTTFSYQSGFAVCGLSVPPDGRIDPGSVILAPRLASGPRLAPPPAPQETAEADPPSLPHVTFGIRTGRQVQAQAPSPTVNRYLSHHSERGCGMPARSARTSVSR